MDTKKGLYYIYKKQNIILYLQKKELYSPSNIYSIVNDIYPYFDETEESEYFSDCYKINKELISYVIKHLGKIDDEFYENQKKSDYQTALQNIPNYYKFLKLIDIPRHSIEDYYVYKILRYLFLGNNSFKYIFEKFTETGNCPSEYLGLMDEFDVDNEIRI